MIEDELRRAGTKLRDLDVRLELGLQESVTSAVRGGYGVTFISRSSVENDLAAGTLVEARVEGLELEREILLVRATRPLRDARRARLRRLRARTPAVIVRWSLDELPATLAEVGIERPFLIASPRWQSLDLPHVAAWTEVPSDRVEVPPERGRDPRRRRRLGDRHGQVRLGGVRQAGRARADDVLGRRVDDVLRDPLARPRHPRRRRGRAAGGDRLRRRPDARPARERDGRHRAERRSRTAPRRSTCTGHGAEGDEEALAGARADRGGAAARARGARTTAPRARSCCAAPRTRATRSRSNRLALAHAMAQALGGTYGLPHGAMNALCLPPALEFNSRFVPDDVARFGDAIGADAVERSRELALLGGFDRLRDFGVPEDELPRRRRGGGAAGGQPGEPPAGHVPQRSWSSSAASTEVAPQPRR